MRWVPRATGCTTRKQSEWREEIVFTAWSPRHRRQVRRDGAPQLHSLHIAQKRDEKRHNKRDFFGNLSAVGAQVRARSLGANRELFFINKNGSAWEQGGRARLQSCLTPCLISGGFSPSGNRAICPSRSHGAERAARCRSPHAEIPTRMS